MRRVDPVVLGSVVAIVCCVAVPVLITSGVAIVLIAIGVSIPIVALAIATFWLSRARSRRVGHAAEVDRPADGRLPGSR